ncbi:MAG: hypothetical protein U5K30_05000 [Acidimicrobiales bacterium]|nr:hypothetical protein [Acidimicrobiales bacterium]
MHLERLVLDSGDQSFATEFHPKFTVIGGLDRAARIALAGEIVDSLAGDKPGVHLEVQSSGRSLTVFRPSGGRHRVIDTDAVADVTRQHLGADGSVDLFAALGVDRALAQRTIRVTRDDIVLRGATDELVNRLASADQEVLWEAAMRLKSADALLEHVSEASGASPTDVALMDEVESRHEELVAATRSYDRVRLISLTIADLGAIAGLTMALDRGAMSGLPFLAVAIMGVILALYYRRNVKLAEHAEREVLSGAGADDYASFHVERVNTLLDSDAERSRFMEAVSAHRHASEQWEEVAGDVSLAFALDHVDQVRAAAGLQQGVRSLHHLSESAPDLSAEDTAELAQALLDRIEAVRALTAGDEVLPLVIDDAFEDLEPNVKPMLLEMLSTAAGSPQMIVVTADDDVTSWARVETMTGDLAVVEPRQQERSTATA